MFGRRDQHRLGSAVLSLVWHRPSQPSSEVE
jgi:hypothetical protein